MAKCWSLFDLEIGPASSARSGRPRAGASKCGGAVDFGFGHGEVGVVFRGEPRQERGEGAEVMGGRGGLSRCEWPSRARAAKRAPRKGNDAVLRPSSDRWGANKVVARPSPDPFASNDAVARPSPDPSKSNGSVARPSPDPSKSNGSAARPSPDPSSCNKIVTQSSSKRWSRVRSVPKRNGSSLTGERGRSNGKGRSLTGQRIRWRGNGQCVLEQRIGSWRTAAQFGARGFARRGHALRSYATHVSAGLTPRLCGAPPSW
jgi:hypothetical protein